MKGKAKLWAIVIVIIVVLGGSAAVAYFLLNKKDDDTGSTSQNGGSANVNPGKEFKPKKLDELSFVQTSTSKIEGQSQSQTLESDGKGNSKNTSDFMGAKLEVYVIGEDSYSCTNGKCKKEQLQSGGRTSTNAETIFSMNDFTKTHIGKAECPAGTCDEWKVSKDGKFSATYFIDSSNRISKAVVTIGSIESTSVFEYKPVTITAPQV